ncbi:hypothetical protein [Mocis latipes granulovirus]|uniref:Uncharacterized protein n=1 Tax=Mocis latipes granulovirus TaxID=2072024 RepID=A0A162GW43_9BBAC|nr:hypothetical protein [Mocis latipes granulovirus]AKR17464.1 hypothetical protein [Mocis latipes granulovirus]
MSGNYKQVMYRDASTNTCREDFYNYNKCKCYKSNNTTTNLNMGNLVDKVIDNEYAKQNKQKDYTNWLKSDAGMSWQNRHYTKQW